MILTVFRENIKILIGSIVTIGILLTFLGLLVLTYQNLVHIFENLFQVNRFTVILQSDLEPDAIREIEKRLGGLDGVTDFKTLDSGKVKAQLKNSLKELEKSLNAVEDRFFPPAVEFTMNRITEKNIRLIKEVEEHRNVQFVINSMNYNTSVQSFFNTIDLFGTIFILLMLVSLYFTVENNIRNLFFNQMKQIEIYVLFGAKSTFILKPFLAQIFAICLAAYGLALAVLQILYYLMTRLLNGIGAENEIVRHASFFSAAELFFSFLVIVLSALFFTCMAFYKALNQFEL